MANINKIRLSGTTYDIQDINVSAHTANTDIHVTASDKTNWNGKLDATAYTPTMVDSALNSGSTNPVENQALFDELRITESETTLVFENRYSTNYPEACTKLIVEVVGSNNYSTINFFDDGGHEVGTMYVNNRGSISVDTSYFQGATYEISGTTVIISYPTVTNVTRIYAYNSDYVHKAVTAEAPTVLKDQVVANTTALSGKQDTLVAGENITISGNVISAQGGSSYTAGDGIDISNDVISVTGKVSTSDFNTYSASTNTRLTEDEEVTAAGLVNLNEAVSAHTADTTIHVTTSDKTKWNKVDDKLNATDFNTYSASTDSRLSEDEEVTAAALVNLNEAVSAHTANTSIHVSAEQIAAWNAKSDFSGSYNDLTNKLSAGTNVTIVDNVINAEGGSITIDPSLDTGSTNAVANSAITTAINAVSGAIPSTYVSAIKADSDSGYQRFYRFSTPSNYNYFLLNNAKINNKAILSTNWGGFDTNFSLVETSAITTSVTSSSTDSQVPSAKAVYTAISGKTNQSDFTGHTTNTSIHVTTTEKAVWNAKSDFSGSYNDLTDKPTIPTVPTSNTAFTNDAGYLVANDITGKTDTSAFTAHTASTVHMTTTEKTNLDSLATNIAAISGITSTKVGNWDTASTNSHTHSNKTVLDGINSTKVSNWDGAATNASNAVTALGGLKLVKLTQAQYNALATKDNSTLYVIVN